MTELSPTARSLPNLDIESVSAGPDSTTVILGVERPENAIVVSRRRDCHFTDALSSSLLKHLLNGEGGAAE